MRRGSLEKSGKPDFLESIRGSPVNELFAEIDEKKSRIRRLIVDETRLNEQRSRKMSVSSYITDGRIRRLSSLCASDALQSDGRGRRRSECVSMSTDLEMRASNNVFSPQRAQRDTGNSIICMSEPSKDSHAHGVPKVLYENSYRMDVNSYIDLPLIKHVISQVLDDKFKGMKYSSIPSIMGTHVKKATNAIIAAVKRLQVNRYRIVSTVTIAQNKGQGIRQSSRCLWSGKNDTWTDASYTNSSMLVHGTVYMIYYE